MGYEAYLWCPLRKEVNNNQTKEDKMVKNNDNAPEGWLYIGDDDNVRYALGKPGSYNLVVVGLNPSTATPNKPDPTIKRIEKIIEQENLDGWIMINLYPERTPNPDQLPEVPNNSVAKKNIEVIRWINQNYHIGCIYAAWGTNIEKRGYLVDECQHIVDSMDPDIPWFMNIPDEFPSAVRQYGNHFLDSLLCILNHNFYRDICKGCYAPQIWQGLDKYSHRNRNCNQAQKGDFRVPEPGFLNLRICDFESQEYSVYTWYDEIRSSEASTLCTI